MATLEITRSHSVVRPAPVAPVVAPVGYLFSQYPGVSHTFFLAEVLGLRALGVPLETASINRPDRPPQQLSAEEMEAASSTRYIKSGGRLQGLLSVLAIAVRNPAVLFRGLLAVAGLSDLTLRKRLQWMFYLAEAMLVGAWMRERKLSHLHVHFGGPVASVGMLTSIAWQVPYSLTIHGPEELLDVSANRLREKVKQAKFVICISDFCRSQLCQIAASDTWDKFEVVRLGVDANTLTPVRTGMPLASRSLKLVCTGRLVPAKGHRILLQALLLLKQRGVTFDTTLIGRGSELETLRNFVDKNGLAKEVTFTSALAHAETLHQLRDADLFALASFAEGIPVALMEAMALGVPCVSTFIAGIPELIRDGIDGLLVAPSNVPELADALARLAQDSALRNRLVRSARERVVADFNLPVNHARLAAVLAERVRKDAA